MSKFYDALEVAKRSDKKQPEHRSNPVFEFGEKRTPTFTEELVVLNDPDSEISECFRFLRSLIAYPVEGHMPRTIMITSALLGEGKTFVATNLAASISQGIEEHVLLIDADLRRPRTHKVFGLPDKNEGLSSYLSKNTPLSDLLIKTAVDKLTILPAGNSTEIPAELLSSTKMKTLIQEVESRYEDRLVIIDSSPLEMTSESSVISKYVDAVILVVRYGKTPRHCVRDAIERIPKEKLLGIVFNANKKRLRRYGGYKYGYGFGYGYGYGKKDQI